MAAIGARAAHVVVPLADVKSGPWRVQVAIKGEPGTLQNLMEVSTSRGALVGDPLIFRGAAGARSAIRPVADMQFYRTEQRHQRFRSSRSKIRRRIRAAFSRRNP